MVKQTRHLPHDIFKHILSYKDPRYEAALSGIKTDSASAWPLNYDDEMDRSGEIGVAKNQGQALLQTCQT